MNTESHLNLWAKQKKEITIAEAVFRYQLQAKKQDKNCVNVFLAFPQDRDPSHEFMQRFLDHTNIKKYSQCVLDRLRPVDQQTGEPGIIVRISAFHWISDHEVEVKGSCFDGDMQIHRYHLHQVNGSWTVGASECLAMS